MLDLLIHFGDSSSGIGALGLNLQSFIIQLITFVIAFFILRKWAFKPILKVLQQRRETIEQGVSLGEEMKRQKASLEAEVEKALQKARADADGILAQAHDAARQLAAEAETKAGAKAEGILKEAEERIKTDTARARQKLESELVGLIGEATEAIIDEKVDAKKDALLIDKALKGGA